MSDNRQNRFGSASAEHPPVAELVAYHEGQISGSAAESLAEHLTSCGECARLILDLAAFPDLEAPAGVEDPSTAETEAAWARLEEGLARPANVVAFPQWRRWVALAAGLGLVAIGFGGGLLTGRQGKSTAVQVPLIDLFAAGSVRGDADGMAIVDPTVEEFVLVLNFDDLEPAAAYDLEIRDADGRPRWSVAGVLPDAFGGFSLATSRRQLGAGEFRVVVAVSGSSPPRAVGEFAFSLAGR